MWIDESENADGIVDIFDIVRFASIYNLDDPHDPKWNSNADIVEDGIIDFFDIVVVAVH